MGDGEIEEYDGREESALLDARAEAMERGDIEMGKKLTEEEQLNQLREDVFFAGKRAEDKERAALVRFRKAVQRALTTDGLGPVQLVGVIRDYAEEAETPV